MFENICFAASAVPPAFYVPESNFLSNPLFKYTRHLFNLSAPNSCLEQQIGGAKNGPISNHVMENTYDKMSKG
jgi:hypothetical protein